MEGNNKYEGTPNVDVVLVLQSFGWKAYECTTNYKSFISKCEMQGKSVRYIGRTNNEGVLFYE